MKYHYLCPGCNRSLINLDESETMEAAEPFECEVCGMDEKPSHWMFKELRRIKMVEDPSTWLRGHKLAVDELRSHGLVFHINDRVKVNAREKKNNSYESVVGRIDELFKPHDEFPEGAAQVAWAQGSAYCVDIRDCFHLCPACLGKAEFDSFVGLNDCFECNGNGWVADANCSSLPWEAEQRKCGNCDGTGHITEPVDALKVYNAALRSPEALSSGSQEFAHGFALQAVVEAVRKESSGIIAEWMRLLLESQKDRNANSLLAHEMGRAIAIHLQGHRNPAGAPELREVMKKAKVFGIV